MTKQEYFQRMHELEGDMPIEFISYGLSPNPYGYCYEIQDEKNWENQPSHLKLELNRICNLAPEGFFESI